MIELSTFQMCLLIGSAWFISAAFNLLIVHIIYRDDKRRRDARKEPESGPQTPVEFHGVPDAEVREAVDKAIRYQTPRVTFK